MIMNTKERNLAFSLLDENFERTHAFTLEPSQDHPLSSKDPQVPSVFVFIRALGCLSTPESPHTVLVDGSVSDGSILTYLGLRKEKLIEFSTEPQRQIVSMFTHTEILIQTMLSEAPPKFPLKIAFFILKLNPLKSEISRFQDFYSQIEYINTLEFISLVIPNDSSLESDAEKASTILVGQGWNIIDQYFSYRIVKEPTEPKWNWKVLVWQRG